MISGENLPFCAVDSNKYIGCVHTPCLLLAFLFPNIQHMISESYSFNEDLFFFYRHTVLVNPLYLP